MKLRVLLGAAVAVALSGCASQPSTIEHYSMYLPQFPSLLVTPTSVTPPPDPATYIAATDKEREQMLMAAYVNQTSNVNTCNIDKSQIASWYTQQQAVVASANAASGVTAAPVTGSGTQATQ